MKLISDLVCTNNFKKNSYITYLLHWCFMKFIKIKSVNPFFSTKYQVLIWNNESTSLISINKIPLKQFSLKFSKYVLTYKKISIVICRRGWHSKFINWDIHTWTIALKAMKKKNGHITGFTEEPAGLSIHQKVLLSESDTFSKIPQRTDHMKMT